MTDLTVIDAVVTSLLWTGPDTKVARLLRELAGDASVRGPCLQEIAERLEPDPAERAARVRAAREWAAASLDRAAAKGLSVVPWFDPAYPPWLRQIPDPPIVLWVLGTVDILARPSVAVVGSRRATPGGLSVARQLGRELAEAGLVVVSGLARGVDAAAHLGALDEHGLTVAVLGCGVDVTYPPEHATLVSRISASGAVISELPPGMPPLAHHFPLRNRIISGLSRAVVVVEASDKSGSLITAKAALEQGRDVLAVPGGVASGKYRGSHALIKDGARLVETVEDVLQEIAWVRPNVARQDSKDKSFEINDLEAEMAAGELYSLDDLAARTGLSASDLLARLGSLELAGRIARAPGGAFIRLDESAIGGRSRDR